MANYTDLETDDEVFFAMEDLFQIEMDLSLHIADKTTLVVFALSSLCNLAALITLGKLPNVKNYCPVRLLQILSFNQLLWGVLHGIEDPRLRPLRNMVPEFVSRDSVCKVCNLLV